MSLASPITIGQCKACLSRPRLLDARSGACLDCLTRRGRRWTALCIRARESPEFRASVRNQLDPRARNLFDAMFGLPSPRIVSRDEAK